VTTVHSDAVAADHPLEFPSSKSSENVAAACPLMDSNPTAAPANNPDVIRVCVNRMFIPFSEPLTC
jgi:hypothetical protein